MNRVCGFLTGMAAGAGLGLLLAPRSGVKTRSLIQRRANDSADYLRKRADDARDAAAEAIRDSTRKVAKGTEAVKAAVEAGKHAFTGAIHS